MSDESEPAVLSEQRGEVLLITLNRPHVRNAVNAAVAEGVATALDTLDSEPSLSAGVLTGTGGFFCAGMDLGAFVKGESPWFGDRGFAGIARRSSRKPLIAAIEGFALAGGLEVALACDLIVAAKGAKLGIPEAKRSLVAAGGALLRLPRRMPYHIVMELALTGEAMPAERFHHFGVVNRLAEPGAQWRSRSSWQASWPRTARLRSPPPRRSSSGSSTGPASRCGMSRAPSQEQYSPQRTPRRGQAPSRRSASHGGRADSAGKPLPGALAQESRCQAR